MMEDMHGDDLAEFDVSETEFDARFAAAQPIEITNGIGVATTETYATIVQMKPPVFAAPPAGMTSLVPARSVSA